MIVLKCPNVNCENPTSKEIEANQFPTAFRCHHCNCILVIHHGKMIPLEPIKYKDVKEKKR